MKRRGVIFIPLLLLAVVLWWRMPIWRNDWNKQTLYVGLLDAWYGQSTDDKAHALWIDDDSTEGVFKIKAIADELGIKPAFAVIADKMTKAVADSLVSWQQQGAGVVLHGFRHERWEEWSEARIGNDIRQSLRRLQEQGFDTVRVLKLVIPPHGCNTRAIRKAISQQGFQMVSGASLVNPDRHVFQLGRIHITSQTDTVSMRQLLQKAYDRQAFVIFGTHSSIPNMFSEKKTREILRIAKEIGFEFDN